MHAFWGGVVKLEDLSGCKEEKHVTVFVFEAELDARKVIKLELHLLLVFSFLYDIVLYLIYITWPTPGLDCLLINLLLLCIIFTSWNSPHTSQIKEPLVEDRLVT